jgi:ABC-type spermidine/putrescine transport system permease subunit I
MDSGLIGTPIKLLSTFSGVAIGLVNALLPFMILVLMTAIQKIDRDLEEAAANLGSGLQGRHFITGEKQRQGRRTFAR